jgi:hypothetical protein
MIDCLVAHAERNGMPGARHKPSGVSCESSS